MYRFTSPAMPKSPLIDLTQDQLGQVVVSAGCLSNDSLNDLIITLATMRLVRRADDADWEGPGNPLHHIIIDEEDSYVIGIKITNCPGCIKDMLGEGGEDEGISGS